MFESNFTTWFYILAGAAVKSTVVLAAAWIAACSWLSGRASGWLSWLRRA